MRLLLVRVRERQMPHYFINVRYAPGPDGLAVDPEGLDFPDVVAVHRYALESARDMIARERSSRITDWLACSFEVEDEHAQIVLRVPFTEAAAATEAKA